jgi:hypothetical protein
MAQLRLGVAAQQEVLAFVTLRLQLVLGLVVPVREAFGFLLVLAKELCA